MGRLAPRIMVEEDEKLQIYGRLREYIGMKLYLHGPEATRESVNCDFVWGTWTYQKGDLPVFGRRNTWLHICDDGAHQ